MGSAKIVQRSDVSFKWFANNDRPRLNGHQRD